MHTVILVIHIIVTFLLIGIVLIQRSDSDGFGLGGGGGNLMTGRSQANFMTRATAILATVFILTSLGLTIVSQPAGKTSLLEGMETDGPLATPEPITPAVPKPE